jgi:hypothetical protein
MANSDQSTNTINNPIGSGVILSQNFRNSVVGGNISNSSISSDTLTTIQTRQKQLDLESSTAIVDQQQSFISFNSGIQSLRADIGKLNSGLNSIALLLQQNAETEQNRILTEQEKERRLTEQEIRIGKENEIEQKIQNAVTEPAQRMVPEVQNLFGGIGRALTYLFGGWLAVETVRSIQSAGQKNIQLFGDIKFDILKKIGIVAGGLFAISAGFTMVKRTMGSIVNGLWKLFIPKPRLGGGGGGKIGGILPGVGKFVAFLSGYLNFKNKEYTDSILAMMSLASMVPGPIGAIGKVAGLAFTADEIAEAFGKNIFGDERDKIVDQIAQQFIGKSNTDTKPPEPPPTSAAKPSPPPTSAAKPSPPPSTAASTGAVVAPATPAIPPAPAPSQPPPAPSQVVPQQSMMGTPATTQMEPPSPERMAQFEQAWQYRNFAPVRGKIEEAWNKLSSQEKTQAKEWAKSKGYDWSEMRLPEPTTLVQLPSNITPTPPIAGVTTSIAPQTVSPPPMSATDIGVQPQISNIPKEPQQVGQLPEPNPKITMIAPFSQSNTPQAPPITDGPLTDVPLISSANPDNFYVLYSQLCYNVVT